MPSYLEETQNAPRCRTLLDVHDLSLDGAPETIHDRFEMV